MTARLKPVAASVRAQWAAGRAGIEAAMVAADPVTRVGLGCALAHLDRHPPLWTALIGDATDACIRVCVYRGTQAAHDAVEALGKGCVAGYLTHDGSTVTRRFGRARVELVFSDRPGEAA